MKQTIRFFLENRLITLMLAMVLVGWGLINAPFQWEALSLIPRDRIAVDAIPDLGENQQIVFTEWAGQSAQDIDDQVTYPLSSALMGLPGVKTIRSNSMFGFSSIYVIFDEDIDFYWSRSRILEKLNSLSAETLPEGVKPQLGPDATALGQVFWYTIEGRDQEGNPAGGWDPHEIRAYQDYNLKSALNAVEGVAEVASIGGFVQEYQIDVDPIKLKAFDISLNIVANAIRKSTKDISAKTIEMNRVEYFVRGVGSVTKVEDLEESLVVVKNRQPIRIKDIATVALGPADRRGALDRAGAEAVGGVVVSSFNANPQEVITAVKKQIEQLSAGMPVKELADGRLSKLTVVPFYDRSQLIQETIFTLEEALTLEILITVLVILVMLINLKAAFAVATTLPIAVLVCFIAMKGFNVQANVVALAGIAIAIGTMVDMAIVLVDNVLQQLKKSSGQSIASVVYEATIEVAPAILTAIATTLVSFIPVFAMEATEGKLFRPLAYTKTFALVAAIVVTLFILPALLRTVLSSRWANRQLKMILNFVTFLAGLALLVWMPSIGWPVVLIAAVGIVGTFKDRLSAWWQKYWDTIQLAIYSLTFVVFLAKVWNPLKLEAGLTSNVVFVILVAGTVLLSFQLFIRYYSRFLSYLLNNKSLFLSIASALLVWGLLSWIGWKGTTGFLGDDFAATKLSQKLNKTFPGLSKEFMPALDEGAFLLMPTTMQHAGIEENIEMLQQLDRIVASIPEVDKVVGKLGRVESALDPAPISMFENLINYKPEYAVDSQGRRVRFRHNEEEGFARNGANQLIPDEDGRYFRNWRPHIKSVEDIWDEIAKISLPGLTGAPKLQPIETRLVMLQSGVRSNMALKVAAPSLDAIAEFSETVELILKGLPELRPETVFAERVVGKPYLELVPDRKQMARFGLQMEDLQSFIQMGVGGMPLGMAKEGRERINIRMRLSKDFRSDPSALQRLPITWQGQTFTLGDVVDVKYVQGPQSIKSENGFLTAYISFDKKAGLSENDAVLAAQKSIAEHIDKGALKVPAGLTFDFAGTFVQQQRAEKQLGFLLPLSLLIIFFILYLQFKSIPESLMIFSTVLLAFAGGFIMIWLFGRPWFMNFELFGENLRQLFHIKPINLSIAVWVGFIALFGIATDDAVLMTTFLKQRFKEQSSLKDFATVREAVVDAGLRRIRPCLMTTATTILALLPILSATGKGADIMIPMAIPLLGGMTFEVISLFILPVLYSAWMERKIELK